MLFKADTKARLPEPRPGIPIPEIHTPNQNPDGLFGSNVKWRRNGGTRTMVIGESDTWDDREIFKAPVNLEAELIRSENRRREFWKKVPRETFELLSKYLRKEERYIEI